MGTLVQPATDGRGDRCQERWPIQRRCCVRLQRLPRHRYRHDRPEIAAAIRRVIPASPVAKRGQRGWTEIGRTSRPIASRRYYGPDGEILVELLGDGRQTVIPPSVHPDTERPYEWLGLATLLNTPLADLPLWPGDIGECLRKELAPFLAPEKKSRPQRSRPSPILTDAMRKRHRKCGLLRPSALASRNWPRSQRKPGPKRRSGFTVRLQRSGKYSSSRHHYRCRV